jgi:hypothetical protein
MYKFLKIRIHIYSELHTGMQKETHSQLIPDSKVFVIIFLQYTQTWLVFETLSFICSEVFINLTVS